MPLDRIRRHNTSAFPIGRKGLRLSADHSVDARVHRQTVGDVPLERSSMSSAAVHHHLRRAVMRRFIVPAVLAFVILAMLAPPGFAQAPAPKVTITGLFDQITSMGRNTYDGNLTRNSDKEWYARTRFRPDIEFAVGRVKAVLGLELDFQYGQSGPNDGGYPGNTSGAACGAAAGAAGGNAGSSPPGGKVNISGCLDLNTDVAGLIEVKWIYTEFPLTGKDSLLPFIPVETMARAGGQPFDTLAQYKLAQYANGDFPGISAITTFAPNIKTNLAYAILEEELAGSNRGNPSLKLSRGEDYAVIFSTDLTPFKGLDVKHLCSFFHAGGQTQGSARRNLTNRESAGGTLNATASRGTPINPSAAGAPDYHEDRHTIGIDARWRMGPFGLDPTFYYQWGRVDSQAIVTGTGATGGTKKMTADMSSFLFDIIGSYQLGPLLLELRGMYSPGNKARDSLAKGIRYYQPLDTDGNYYAQWTPFYSSSVDYFNQGWTTMGNYVGYDRYGRGEITGRVTYRITPALSAYLIASPMFTAQAVDTDTGTQLASAAGTGTQARTTVSAASWVKGDSNYLGTEAALGLTWRFSANTAFELIGAWLFAGDAFNAAECRGGAATTCLGGTVVNMDAKDAYTLAARLRLAF